MPHCTSSSSISDWWHDCGRDSASEKCGSAAREAWIDIQGGTCGYLGSFCAVAHRCDEEKDFPVRPVGCVIDGAELSIPCTVMTQITPADMVHAGETGQKAGMHKRHA